MAHHYYDLRELDHGVRAPPAPRVVARHRLGHPRLRARRVAQALVVEGEVPGRGRGLSALLSDGAFF